MTNKKIILLGILIISILTISAVSAAENVAMDAGNMTEDVSQEVVSVEESDEPASVEASVDDAIGIENQYDDALNANPGTFRQLDNAINGNTNKEVYLHGDYTFRPGSEDSFSEGIKINRNLTVYGNGFTLDGAKAAIIFWVQGISEQKYNVVFKDIKFINTFNGAIKGGTCINCTFINNTAEYGEGAISYGNAVNCTFINNTVIGSGAAIYHGSAEYCTFINNTSKSYGGAIYEGSAVNCTFINNFAKYCGGAIYNGDAVNCTFINNTSEEDGGAIYRGDALNCTFIDNKAKNGGAICGYHYSIAGNCTFTNNQATENGGAVYDNEVIDCVFTNNTAKNGGATYRSDAFGCEFTNNRATESGGAMYGDEIYYRNNATYCIFTDNSAKNGGAVYMTIVNYSDFINNSASENGGAMYNSTGTNCYFINNSASQKGGAMYNSTGIYCYFRDNNAQTGGDDAYASELVKFSTELTATAKIITVYDAENYLVISLKDQFGNPFIGYDVSVIINGRTFTVCTQEDGRAMMPTDELAPGKYNAKITFEGDSNYAGSTAFSQITVKKAKAKIIAKKKTFKRKVKTKKYAVTLYAQEYLLDNLKVTLKIGKKTYSAKTNSNGKATFKIKKLKKKGKYSATVKFAGNSYYTAYSIKTKITVK